jgi:SNF2 family DNA or RNA helicase
VTFSPKTKPYKHQAECLERFGDSNYYGLLAEMGTGKTWIMINDMAKLAYDGKISKAVVFAPNGVQTNWHVKELPKHMPEGISWMSHLWTPKKTKRASKELVDFFNAQADLKIVLMNWEALASERGYDMVAKFLRDLPGESAIFCDESDAIKNPSSVRTKRLMKLRQYTMYRRIATGTPINNAPFDLFAQMSFLNSQILRTDNYQSFKARHAQMLPRSVVQKMVKGTNRVPQIVAKDSSGKPKYRNLDKLTESISPYCFRITKAECLDLPEKIYTTVYFDMTPTQQKVYDSAAKDFRIKYEETEAPLTKLGIIGKLSQITSGWFINPDTEEVVRIEGENRKLAALKEAVDRIVASGEKVIIWARLVQEIKDIVEVLKDHSCVTYYGETSPEERTAAIDAIENGEANVFIGNQQAGGTGITLVKPNNVIYYSNNFSLRDRLQSEDRAHRIGQTKNVVYTNIVARGSIDEKIVSCLEGKEDLLHSIVSF